MNLAHKKSQRVSEETKKKISLTLKGRSPWNKGKKHSKEHIEKSRQGHIGGKRSQETRKRMSIAAKARNRRWLLEDQCRPEGSKRKTTLGLAGKDHYNWKGGITPVTRLIRKSFKYQEWRQRVFIRDDFVCQKCRAQKVKIEAHHIKPFEKLLEEVKAYLPLYSLYEGAMLYTPLWNTDNGKTLCLKCHYKTRKKRR